MAFVFPYPEDSDLRPIVVPYYSFPKYDHTAPSSFVNFAQRNGFMLSKSSLDLEVGYYQGPSRLSSADAVVALLWPD
jgi:hypothetical protein